MKRNSSFCFRKETLLKDMTKNYTYKLKVLSHLRGWQRYDWFHPRCLWLIELFQPLKKHFFLSKSDVIQKMRTEKKMSKKIKKIKRKKKIQRTWGAGERRGRRERGGTKKGKGAWYYQHFSGAHLLLRRECGSVVAVDRGGQCAEAVRLSSRPSVLLQQFGRLGVLNIGGHARHLQYAYWEREPGGKALRE